MMSVIWAVVAMLLFLAQFVTGVFDLLFVAVAAMGMALASALIPGFGDAVWLQVLLWVATSFLSVWAFRKRFKALFRGEELRIDRTQDAGQKAKVIEAIAPGKPGRISLHGTSWTAQSLDEEIAAGSEVYILELEGMNYTVTSHALDELAQPRPDSGRLPPGAAAAGIEGPKKQED